MEGVAGGFGLARPDAEAGALLMELVGGRRRAAARRVLAVQVHAAGRVRHQEAVGRAGQPFDARHSALLDDPLRENAEIFFALLCDCAGLP